MSLARVLADVAEERARQDEKWGPQHWPDIYGPAELAATTRVMYTKNAQDWKRVNDAREANGHTTWDGVLLEEVFEALEHAGSDSVKFRDELVQVAAVAVLIVQDLDSRGRDVPLG